MPWVVPECETEIEDLRTNAVPLANEYVDEPNLKSAENTIISSNKKAAFSTIRPDNVSYLEKFSLK